MDTLFPIEEYGNPSKTRRCKKCNESLTWYKTQWRCVSCYKQYMKEYGKQYYATHPQVYKSDPQVKRDKNYRQKYNLSLEEYEKIFEEQNGVCLLCNRPERAKNRYGDLPLAVDHDHSTGVVRALLCNSCNRAFGFLDEDPMLIMALLEYALKWKITTTSLQACRAMLKRVLMNVETVLEDWAEQ